jgi:hypothetical protein
MNMKHERIGYEHVHGQCTEVDKDIDMRTDTQTGMDKNI